MISFHGVLKRHAAVLLLLGCSALPASALTERTIEYSTSYWLVIFNHPAACATDPCGPDDLLTEATLADVCHLATRSAAAGGPLEARFAAGSAYGCLAEFDGVGLIDPYAAELQVLMQEHDSELDGATAWRQTAATRSGDCAGCAARGLAVHRPGDADPEGRTVAGLSGSGATLLIREYDGVRLVLEGGEASAPDLANVASAGLELDVTEVDIAQTQAIAYELTKEGALDAQNSTVTWHITVSEEAMQAGLLRVSGAMTLANDGSGPATIGNIVVNLQTRTGSAWSTASSNVADATYGDGATTANIHALASSEGLSTFTENAASGTLQFIDATDDTIFSLVPQIVIEPGATRSLAFQAAFDNNVLGLATGTPIRAEVIASFGNAAPGNSSPNVDINGNGTIDADEARVRSVPSRHGVEVPAPVNGNSTVTLTDTIDDIATTGTVSFSNAQFNLGATSGTVTVTVDGGEDGGSITNCAHLTGATQTVGSGGFTFPMVNGVDLTDCSTITVAGNPSCTPGAPGCGWELGDLHTFTQLGWDSTSTGAALLSANYSTVYAPTAGIFDVGIVGSAGFSMTFTSAANLLAYLPATGTVAALSNDLLNPTSSASGVFGGHVVALKLNIEFSDDAVLPGSASIAFGDLRLCNLAAASLNGLTVRQLLGVANTALGGGVVAVDIATLSSLANDVNGAFSLGAPTTFSQTHLFSTACP